MNTEPCKSDEGDETHGADRSQEFFEDAFSCLYEIDASTQVSDINLGFGEFPFLSKFSGTN